MVLRMETERPVWKFLRGLGKQMEAACYVVAVTKTEECVVNVQSIELEDGLYNVLN